MSERVDQTAMMGNLADALEQAAASTQHRAPRTWWQKTRYDRARGRGCEKCTSPGIRYLDGGTWYDGADRPIRTATHVETLRARLTAWKHRRTYRHLAHVIITQKRAQHAP